MMAGFFDRFKKKVDDIKEDSEDFATKAKEKTEDIGEDIKEKAEDLAAKAKEKAEDFGKDIKEKAEEFAAQAKEKKDEINEHTKETAGNLSEDWDKVLEDSEGNVEDKQ
ncbi:MAG: hypothetical protein Q8S24_09510 [Eubacteriales bacterium]|nr:hypothetical protein [Eubacteriales bacterium]